ncbi:MAG: type II toxin-antitoxin system HicA family toxin [Patescibacteria group bacterium]|nr:type II toxin-antitoxin system HicA family toxin [Patescibacteria group bacterium]
MRSKFPVDAPIRRVSKALQSLGFRIVRDGPHLAMLRQNDDGTTTPLTLPNHPTLKSSTLRTVLTQTGISRDDFLTAYEST